jgi:hypothetical protein
MKFYFLFLLTPLLFWGCDPGLSGELKIHNHSTREIVIVYDDLKYPEEKLTLSIGPGEIKTVKVLGGLGNKKTFDCCPCELMIDSVYSSKGKLKKDPTTKENWEIPNKNKLKKFGKEPIHCAFHVYEEDL